jgi:hypothetical protein
MFEQLRGYRNLAWDFDDTLVGHSLSEEFWRFIRVNPYQQTHHIITMRSHGLETRMFAELEWRDTMLDESHFEHVINVSNDLYESYEQARRHDMLTDQHPYFHFKGEMCREIGAEVLIDDMEASAISKLGCDRFGIRHIHPDELITRP